MHLLHVVAAPSLVPNARDNVRHTLNFLRESFRTRAWPCVLVDIENLAGCVAS